MQITSRLQLLQRVQTLKIAVAQLQTARVEVYELDLRREVADVVLQTEWQHPLPQHNWLQAPPVLDECVDELPMRSIPDQNRTSTLG